MGKTVATIVGVVVAVGIAIAAPYLAPLALGVLGISATATALAIATAVIAVGLSLAASFAFRALGVGAGPPSAKNQIGPPQVFRQAISDSFIVYGKRRVGGLLVFFHARQDGTGEHYRYFVVACAGHRCKDLVSWMLNDTIVTVDGSGMVTSGDYAGNAWLFFQRGLASETANATFVAESDGLWTSAHKGNGVAALYAKFHMVDAVVQAGMPNITAIIEGRDEVLDTRTGATGYTRNAALIFYDFNTIPREEGGFGAYADEIPASSWINAQANVCDETVNSAPRYTIDGVIQTGAPPSEVRDALVVAQAGTYTFSGGKHLMRPGYWVPSSATLSEDDLAGPVQVSPFMPPDSAATEAQGSYVSPSANYTAAPLTTQDTPGATDVLQVDVDLPFVTNKDQGDRILKIMLKRAACEKTVVWPMNIAGLGIRAMDTVQPASTRYSLDNYAFQVSAWGLSSDFGIILNLREENSEIYDDGSAVAPPSPPAIGSPPPLLTQAEIISLIQDSWPLGLTFSIADTGAVTISTHSRVYRDKTVSVTGTGGTPHATSATAGQLVYIYYDDPDRLGGAVVYHHLVLPSTGGDSSSAYCSPTHPYRHLVCAGPVPASGGTTSGGSDTGSGGGTVPPGCPVEETPVLLANAAGDGPGETLAIGDDRVAVGARVWTRHPATGAWGAYPITYKRRDYRPVLRAPGLPRATADHPFDLGLTGEWTRMEAIGVRDGWAWTILLTVAEAHSYFTPGGGDIRREGVLSHNKSAFGLE